MSRPHSAVPSYRKHKQSGQAIVTLTDGLGGRRDLLLGRHGTKESRVEYARVIAEWETAGRSLPQSTRRSDLTINELTLLFWRHVEQHYRRPDGTATQEVEDYRLTLKPLKRLYGHTAVSDFGPLALKALRQSMVDGSWLTAAEKGKRQETGHKRTWSRGVVNQRIGRVKRLFKWGVENELVPATVLHALQAVRGLSRGRSEARENEPVKPVPAAFVAAILPHLLPQTRAMVELQLVTGMRPGEVVAMRGIDLDTSGAVWLYRPAAHKTSWRGHQRVIAIGPRGQEILKPWLRLGVEEFLFQPQEAMAWRRATQRQKRKSAVQPSQEDRSKRNPRKSPGDRYGVIAYGKAIARAIQAANKIRACAPCKPLDAAERCATCKASAVPHWHPHQLRHTKATEIRREYGLDAARAVLGHRSPAVTEVYAELDAGKATEVALRLG